MAILKNVWTVADARQQHYLTREDFYVALRLIALAQNGLPPTREKLVETAAAPMPYARFQNVPVQPPPPPPSSSGAPSPVLGGADPYAMSAEDRGRYLNHFAPCDTNGDGFVEGPQAVDLFSRSGLDRAVLGKVWELSDADKDSRLSPNEFAVAMHLIVCISKRGLPVPPRLPGSLASVLGVVGGGGSGVSTPVSVGSPAMPSSPHMPTRPPLAHQQHSPGSVGGAKPPINVGMAPPSPSLHDTSMSALASTSNSSSPSILPRAPTLSSSIGASSSSKPPTPGPVGGGGSGPSSSELSGMASEMQDLAQKLKAEKISLNATVEGNASDVKRTTETLAKALQEVTALQAELASLRKAAATADEENRQALQNLGAARKHRELLLIEVDKARQEVERLHAAKASLAEELGSLKLDAAAVQAGGEGLSALAADHQAETATNQSEVGLLQSLLSSLAASKSALASDVAGLQTQVGAAKEGLVQDQAALDSKKTELAQARKDRDATTAERHTALLRLASGELTSPSSLSISTTSTSAKSAPLTPPVKPASPVKMSTSPSSTAAPVSAAKPPAATKSAFGFDEEDDAFASKTGSGSGSFSAPAPAVKPASPVGPAKPIRSPSPRPQEVPTNGGGVPAPTITTAASSGDEFDFPAPEEGGVDDAFPAPEQAFGAPKPPTPASTTGAAAVHAPSTSGGDPFASDPFGFPEDNAFGAPVAGEGTAPTTAAAPKGSGFDDFDTSAFDKF